MMYSAYAYDKDTHDIVAISINNTCAGCLDAMIDAGYIGTNDYEISFSLHGLNLSNDALILTA